MNPSDAADFASALFTALETIGYDELFVTYLNGWERRANRSTTITEHVKFVWLATPVCH